MTAAELHRRLRAANPVPAPPPRPLSAEDERLLLHVVGTRRRTVEAVLPRLTPLLVASAVAAACVIAALTLVRSGSTIRHDGGPVGSLAGGAVPAGAIVHVSSRVYAAGTKSGVGVRIEGWAQSSSGRARIVVRGADGTLRSQVTVDQADRVRRWTRVGRTPPRQVTSRQRSSRLADHQRRLVADRLAALVQESRAAIDPQSVRRGDRRVRHVRYAGRAAIETEWIRVVRIGVPIGANGPPQLREETEFIRTYRAAETGAPLGFERGWVRRGRHVLDYGERVVTAQVLTGAAAGDDLGWKPTPRLPGVNRPAPTATPTPASRGASPTPTPTPRSGARPAPTPTPRPGATPTPTPSGAG